MVEEINDHGIAYFNEFKKERWLWYVFIHENIDALSAETKMRLRSYKKIFTSSYFKW